MMPALTGEGTNIVWNAIMKPLFGKAVVITGAGSGLGAAYARHAAALGASILVNDIDPAAADRTVAAIRGTGHSAVASAGDIASWNFARSLVDTCIDAFGTISGVVNNAGVFRPALIDDLSEADLELMLRVNVLGTAACGSHAVKRLRELGMGGSIINVASGSHAGDIALGGYGASKGAIASLTYSWAMELRNTGIRVNAISPLAETAMAAQNAALMSVQAANREVHYASLPPPEVNAPVVSFLLSDAAAKINGQIVRIANGQLSFVTHPIIADPVLTGEWTFETVTEAFAAHLDNRQQPLGLAYVRKPDGDV